ncbi:hypothetical protein [Mucilaginibacter sp.]|uniref:hypothetical protein n=1 Tax=Mucilaginibacter sp. TaxID=1882438 RepID=UPI0026158A61|nr:hypothetical protein [Mucilaginibacter sp.]
MARTGYIIHNQQAIYYMTFTGVGWIEVLSRQTYRDVVIDSFKYCQKNKDCRCFILFHHTQIGQLVFN